MHRCGVASCAAEDRATSAKTCVWSEGGVTSSGVVCMCACPFLCEWHVCVCVCVPPEPVDCLGGGSTAVRSAPAHQAQCPPSPHAWTGCAKIHLAKPQCLAARRLASACASSSSSPRSCPIRRHRRSLRTGRSALQVRPPSIAMSGGECPGPRDALFPVLRAADTLGV